MRRGILSVFVFLAITAAAPAAGAQQAEPPCSGAQHPRRVAELLFGRNIGRHAEVSESAWSRFVTRELAPHFPDGLTVTDAVGLWRDRTKGRLVREPSKRVEIVLPGNADDQTRLDAAALAYKKAFSQKSVGVIVRSACVSF